MLSQDSPRVVTPHAHDTSMCLSRTAHRPRMRAISNAQDSPGAHPSCAWPHGMPRCSLVRPLVPSTAHAHGYMCMARRPALYASGQGMLALTSPTLAQTRHTHHGQAVDARCTRAPEARCVAHAHAQRPHCTQHRARNPHTRLARDHVYLRPRRSQTLLELLMMDGKVREDFRRPTNTRDGVGMCAMAWMAHVNTCPIQHPSDTSRSFHDGPEGCNDGRKCHGRSKIFQSLL